MEEREAVEGRGGVWVPGAVTSLQTLQTLGVSEVGAVTKALQGRYKRESEF